MSRQTMVLVLRAARQEAPVQVVLPLRIDVALEVLTEFASPGRGGEQVGHGGGTMWARTERAGQGWRVVVHEIGAAATWTVDAPQQPAALHVVDGGVVVGAGETIAWIDVRGVTPTWREIHRRPEVRGKAYDLFARAGAWLVALDDILMPKYADSFTLSADGPPVHTAAWTLPATVNGDYVYAGLVPTAERDAVLFIVESYGHMGGRGQVILALPIRGDTLMVSQEVQPDVPTFGEHVVHDLEDLEAMFDADPFTPWGGLAVDEQRVLVTAGTRGLLVLPHGFTAETRPTVVDVDGECRDVLVADGRTWVLVGGAEDAVVELAWDGDGAHERGRTRLPGSFDRFVR